VAGLGYSQHAAEAPDPVRRRVHKVPLSGDSARLRAATRWRWEISFDELVQGMIAAEFERRY
jgi:GDP-D-mannose dehydratase